jgi:hypothetical protein
MGCFHTVLVFSHFVNLAISLQRQNIRTPKFAVLYRCILSISMQILRAIPHIFAGQSTNQCCSRCSTVISTINIGQITGKKTSQDRYMPPSYDDSISKSIKQRNSTRKERAWQYQVSVQTPLDASILGGFQHDDENGRGSKVWLVPKRFPVTRAWQKCENTRSISFRPFQYLTIVLKEQKLYQFVEYIYSSLALYFIL